MKILIVSQYFYPEEMRINNIVKHLTSQGNQVTVLTGLPNYPKGRIYPGYRFGKKRREKLFGAEVVRVPLIARRNNLLFLALNYVSFAVSSCVRALFMKKDFDVIFVYQLSPVSMAYPALLLKKLTGKRLVLYCLDMWPESFKYGSITEANPQYKSVARISKGIYSKCDLICTTSETHKKYMHTINGVSEEKIKVLYQYDYESDNGIREFESDGYNVTYVGNIGQLQSVITVLQAAELLKEEKIYFHIMGSGSELENCRKYAKEKRLEKVIFYGQIPLSQGQAAIRGSDINIICMKKGSETDYPFPGKIQTALLCGTPIVYAAESEGAFFIEENQCGVRCDSENPRQLAEAVKNLLGDSEKRELFSKNAGIVYEKHFSEQIFMKKLISFFERNE